MPQWSRSAGCSVSHRAARSTTPHAPSDRCSPSRGQQPSPGMRCRQPSARAVIGIRCVAFGSPIKFQIRRIENRSILQQDPKRLIDANFRRRACARGSPTRARAPFDSDQRTLIVRFCRRKLLPCRCRVTGSFLFKGPSSAVDRKVTSAITKPQRAAHKFRLLRKSIGSLPYSILVF